MEPLVSLPASRFPWVPLASRQCAGTRLCQDARDTEKFLPQDVPAAHHESPRHSLLHRRAVLRLAGLGGASWLTSVAHLLARETEQAATQSGSHQPAQSLIVLWLAGGPSQLDTFDPHPGQKISGDTRAIETAVQGIQLADGLERVAQQMGSISLVRSLVSKEGDHQRGTYLVKTGYRPDPTAVHPSIGAICCHELPAGGTDIPRHISILPNQWPGRGGFLGEKIGRNLGGGRCGNWRPMKRMGFLRSGGWCPRRRTTG